MTWWHYLLGAVLFSGFLWWLRWAIRRHERELDSESDSEWMDRQK